MDARTVWASIDHGERVRRLAESAVRLGPESRAAIVADAMARALEDAERDRRVVDAVVADIRATDPRGISSEALR